MNYSENASWKYWIIRVGLFVSFGILVSNIFKLTVIKQKYYQTLARDNRITQTEIPAQRGTVYDRKGRVIAKSIYQYYKKDGETKLVDETGDFKGYQFNGKDLMYDINRQYPYGESLGFISGYVGRMNENDAKKNKCQVKYSDLELIGRGGVEEVFDCSLRGVEGERLVEVDARGKFVRDLGKSEPKNGNDLNLSIDAYWQDKIYKLLNGRKAVVIVSEPKTGKIISLVSSPGFDPNAFASKNNEVINGYLADSNNLPLLNRAIAAKYYPGSTFKIVMASAGLQTGEIDNNTTFEDTGIIKIGSYSYSNWAYSRSGKTDGMVDVVTGLKRSNDIFFYKLGEKLGVDQIKTWSNNYGYGKKTGIELPGELTGTVPDNQWKMENKGEKWFLGDTYHLSIGQGYLSVTPLQVNQMTDIIANHGVKCDMSILKDEKPNCKNIGLSSNTWQTVIQGMVAACHSGGTAWPLFNFKTPLACKTGTAEVGDGTKDSHAWLTVFGPVDDPQIAVTVLVERGGEGSDAAAPIAGDFLKEWFNEPNTAVPRYSDQRIMGE